MFRFFAPLLPWRHVKVTDQRTAVDWAHCMQDLVAVHCPAAERLVVVHDHLHPHPPAALSAALPPEEAKRLWDRLACHATPKHDSGFNRAEIAVSVLSRQCLTRRIPDHPPLQQEGAAWETRRNENNATVPWQFPTADARGKLQKRSPVLKPSD